MFPLKLCGAWTLIYSNNHGIMLNTKMNIDYNRVKFSPLSKVGFMDVTKNMYGLISVQEERAKVIWLKNIDYEVNTYLLPVIQFPYQEKMCIKTMIDYKIEDSYITIYDGIYEYVFTRDLSPKNYDSIIKIFITQLLFDLIIRHI